MEDWSTHKPINLRLILKNHPTARTAFVKQSYGVFDGVESGIFFGRPHGHGTRLYAVAVNGDCVACVSLRGFCFFLGPDITARRQDQI